MQCRLQYNKTCHVILGKTTTWFSLDWVTTHLARHLSNQRTSMRMKQSLCRISLSRLCYFLLFDSTVVLYCIEVMRG